MDVGTTKRKAMSPTRRLRIWEDHKGVCCLCGGKIDGVRERWIVEHMRALALGGEDADENCAPAHEACASSKTKNDVSMITKAKRQKQKHLGIKAANGWNTRFRKKMNGDVIDTRTGEIL